MRSRRAPSASGSSPRGTHRSVVHIVPSERGRTRGWIVQSERTARAGDTYKTKDAAIVRGREIAKSSGLSQLVVHGKNGKIQFEWTYERDPRRTKG
jgi:hypothetical protein